MCSTWPAPLPVSYISYNPPETHLYTPRLRGITHAKRKCKTDGLAHVRMISFAVEIYAGTAGRIAVLVSGGFALGEHTVGIGADCVSQMN